MAKLHIKKDDTVVVLSGVDEESDVLTIRHDDVPYSPWNQKSITF